MSLEQWMSDFTIDNNGTLEDLKFNLDQLMTHLEVGT
jgi:dephospho-CoA kinase